MRLPPDIPTEVAASLAPKEWDVYRLAYGSALAEGDSQPGAAARASAAVGALRVLAAGGEAIVLKYDLTKHTPGGHEHDQSRHGHRRGVEGTNDALLARLPERAQTADGAELFLQDTLKELAERGDLVFYHEGPGDLKDSFERAGIKGDYGIFATINRPSGFTTTREKTIVAFRLPRDLVERGVVGPDMRYGHPEDKLTPVQMLLAEHPEVVGADVSINLGHISPSWFTTVERIDKRFDPNQPRRPRGDPEGGQWTEGTAAAALTEAAEDRASWPAHIRAIKVPPAWTDVRYSDDPRADLLAVGRDAKGRPQYVYSARFAEKRAALKFARIRELDDKFEAIEAQNRENQRSDDSEVREHADALALIMETGLRPGSDTDTRAARRAYGATTLEGRHVVRAGRETRLRFVGKKGADLDVLVRDKRVAGMLRERARHAGSKGRLFPRTSDASLREYAATLDGGGFRPKDFRTYLGTTIAASEVAKLPAPRSAAAYKRAVRGVAKTVAAALGNTPTVALQSYIDPFVFSRLRAAAGA